MKLRSPTVRADSVEAVLEHLDLAGAEVRRASPNWAEKLVRFLTHPVVSSLLLTLGMLGIIVELRTPASACPARSGSRAWRCSSGGTGWCSWPAGRSCSWSALGLVLLALEIFVIPGFGVAGVAGDLALLGGLGLSLVGAGATWQRRAHGGGARRRCRCCSRWGGPGPAPLPAAPAVRPTASSWRPGLTRGPGYASAPESDLTWLGKRGTAASPLRPAGIAEIEGERVDVVSEGEFIEAGAPSR